MDNIIYLIDRRIAKLLGRRGAKGEITYAKVAELKALRIDVQYDKSSPRYQYVLQKWLREKHKIDIYIFPLYSDSIYSKDRKLIGYTPIIQSIKIDECSLKTENSYEEALRSALEEGLKIIKNSNLK